MTIYILWLEFWIEITFGDGCPPLHQNTVYLEDLSRNHYLSTGSIMVHMWQMNIHRVANSCLFLYSCPPCRSDPLPTNKDTTFWCIQNQVQFKWSGASGIGTNVIEWDRATTPLGRGPVLTFRNALIALYMILGKLFHSFIFGRPRQWGHHLHNAPGRLYYWPGGFWILSAKDVPVYSLIILIKLSCLAIFTQRGMWDPLRKSGKIKTQRG